MLQQFIYRMEMEVDYDDGVRYWRAWCRSCRDIKTFDSELGAIDFMDNHICPEDEEMFDDE
jgi:hypothetical protein